MNVRFICRPGGGVDAVCPAAYEGNIYAVGCTRHGIRHMAAGIVWVERCINGQVAAREEGAHAADIGFLLRICICVDNVHAHIHAADVDACRIDARNRFNLAVKQDLDVACNIDQRCACGGDVRISVEGCALVVARFGDSLVVVNIDQADVRAKARLSGDGFGADAIRRADIQGRRMHLVAVL